MPKLTRFDSIYANHSKDIDRSAQDFGDHEGVTKGKIVRWISNFSDEHTGTAAKILQKMRYYSASNIRSMTCELVKIAKQEFTDVSWDKVIFVPIGETYGGSAVIARALRETHMVLTKNIKHIADLEKVLPTQMSALVFVDDFCGTGDTLKEWWPIIESIVLPKNAPFAIALLVLNGTARAAAQELTDKILCVEELDENDNVLSANSKHFTPVEKSIILGYCRKTGCSLDIVRGHGDCGLLLAFKYACPDNSLPILWYENHDWEALFKRHAL